MIYAEKWRVHSCWCRGPRQFLREMTATIPVLAAGCLQMFAKDVRTDVTGANTIFALIFIFKCQLEKSFIKIATDNGLLNATYTFRNTTNSPKELSSCAQSRWGFSPRHSYHYSIEPGIIMCRCWPRGFPIDHDCFLLTLYYILLHLYCEWIRK